MSVFYMYSYDAMSESWELRQAIVVSELDDGSLVLAVKGQHDHVIVTRSAFESSYAETALEARRLAYEQCEKMRQAMLSHAKSWESLQQKLSADNQWREFTPCRRCDGAMLGDYCKTHDKWCFREDGNAQS